MDLDSIIRTFLSRSPYQRLFMAFTVGLFLSCAARVSEAQPGPRAARATVAQTAGVAGAAARERPETPR